MADDVLRHEFGHLIAAKHLGFKTGLVLLKAKSAGAEIVLDVSLPALDDVASYIDRRIQVLYGGALAECLRKNNTIDASATSTKLRSTAADDFTKIREIMRIAVGIRNPEATANEFQTHLTAAKDDLFNRAAMIITQEAALIREMVDFFLDKRRAASPKGKAPLTEFTLAAEDIDGHPSIVSRFGTGA
jgi:hypothetical protein